MMTLFKAGGFPMWFILVFGAAAFIAAVLFARRPVGRDPATVRALSLATLFSIFGGTAADFGAVCTQVPAHPEWTAGGKMFEVVLQGFGESMSPSLLGFTLLSLTWLVVAVGHRRAAVGA
jgi:hypothetical protein